MTDLAKLVVRLEAQTAQFNKEMAAVNSKLKGFESTSKAVMKGVAGAFAGFQIVGFAKGVIDAADKMNDLSKQTGVAVEDLSRLEYAAGQNGGSIESLAKGLKNLSKNAVEAAGGSKAQVEAFKQMGVEVRTVDGGIKPLRDLLLDSADAFSKVKDSTEKAALAQKIFGKAGLEMIPFLNQGRDGIDALMKQADALGITLSQDAASAADDFNDSLAAMKGASVGAGRDLLFTLLPALTALAKVLGIIAVSGRTVFEGVGKSIGGLAAAGVAAVSGNLKEARTILKLMDEDAAKLQDTLGTRLNAILSDVPKMPPIDSSTLESFDVMAGKAKNVDKALAEVVVTATKLGDMSPMSKFYESLNANTETALEKQTAALNKFKAELDELEKAGMLAPGLYQARWTEALNAVTSETMTALEKQSAAFGEFEQKLQAQLTAEIIDPKQYTERWSEAFDDLMPELRVTAKKLGTTLTDEFNKASEFMLEAARDTKTIFADTILGAMTGKIGDIEEAFTSMINKLVAEALAANLAEKLFGSVGAGGGSGGGGWLDAAFNWVAGIFGGSKDKGGAGKVGVAYAIGKVAQPEVFVPTSASKLFGGSRDRGGKGNAGTSYAIGTAAQPEIFLPDNVVKLFGGSRDKGGLGKKGTAYAIGTGAQPEVFVPSEPGMFYPKGKGLEKMFGGSRDMGGRGSAGLSYAIGAAAQPEMFVPDRMNGHDEPRPAIGTGSRGMTQNIYVQGQVDARTRRQLALDASRNMRSAQRLA